MSTEANITVQNPETKPFAGPVSVEIILENARDWCDPKYLEPHIKEALALMVDEFNEKKAPPVVVEDFISTCIFQVVGALKVSETLAQHPEILEKPVLKPLFVTGLPRTGTTLLHRLLARDPNARPLLAWEAFQPTPPPQPETYQTDPRISYFQNGVDPLMEDIKSAHFMAALSPEECTHLFSHQFYTTQYFLKYNLPSFRKWFLAADMTPAYAFYKKTLQLLDWRFPEHHWVLKAPSHLMFLKSLVANFPDASIIQTHRNPLEAIPSGMSLNLKMQAPGAKMNPKELGQRSLPGYGYRLERGMKARNDLPEEPFLDVSYKDLVSNPIPVVRKIYDHFGYEYTPEFEENMEKFITQNPKGKHGAHRYSLDQFGITEEQVRQTCGSYMDRFEAFL